jgi:hypothetical protein
MKNEREPARAGGSAQQKVVPSVNHIEANEVNQTAVARSTGLSLLGASFLGSATLFTPGFMLSPASRALTRTDQ